MKLFTLLLTALLLMPWQTLPAAATPAERCFPETGICMGDPIRSYWERNGGLATFGIPTSSLVLQTAEGRTLKVQWFERDRLEIQHDGTVTAGRLGTRWLELQGRPWQTFPTVSVAEPGCFYFAVTGHQVCEPFLSYWRTQGGLERFGYPITERFTEEIEGRSYTVQYFERRRMELHPEFAGTRYEILLGRLGVNVAATDSCVPLEPRFEPTAYAYRTIIGCPGGAGRELVGNDRFGLRPVPLAFQQFEGGMMLWIRQFGGDALGFPEIFVITPAPGNQPAVWQRFADEWREGQPTGVVDEPPPGRYAPVRGFGYLWATNAEVRAQLGWALAPEQGEAGGYRRFSKGFFLYRPAIDRVYLVTDDRLLWDVARVPEY
ncbi:MAG: hypothetical protein MUD01_13820 [Chloroflexaceae bacterium]|jgi:hypothetical protein|nr:hypothetical protein [Chloroflexaceae bacterium]